MGVGLCQGCPLSLILFVIFMDRISRRSCGEGCVWLGNLRIALLLFADIVVLLASSARDVQQALGWFAVECEVVGMRVSTSKSKAIVLCWKKVDYLLRLGDELLPQVREFILRSYSRVGMHLTIFFKIDYRFIYFFLD